jgi:hypothetical protein
MPSGTERGHAVLSRREDGTTTVAICTAITNGQPNNIYARFFGMDTVKVDPALQLTGGESFQYTNEIVEVYADQTGVVHVSAIKPQYGLTLAG